MRVMVIVKATPSSEAAKMPDEKMLADMGKYNEDLVKAGIMLAGEGLHPSSRGKRIAFSGSSRTVIDGPFTETKELVAGFWLWQVRSIDEAVEWARRCPNPMPEDSELEIRQVFEMDDFGAEFTPELREQEQRLRDDIAAREVEIIRECPTTIRTKEVILQPKRKIHATQYLSQFQWQLRRGADLLRGHLRRQAGTDALS